MKNWIMNLIATLLAAVGTLIVLAYLLGEELTSRAIKIARDAIQKHAKRNTDHG